MYSMWRLNDIGMMHAFYLLVLLINAKYLND